MEAITNDGAQLVNVDNKIYWWKIACKLATYY